MSNDRFTTPGAKSDDIKDIEEFTQQLTAEVKDYEDNLPKEKKAYLDAISRLYTKLSALAQTAFRDLDSNDLLRFKAFLDKKDLSHEAEDSFKKGIERYNDVQTKLKLIILYDILSNDTLDDRLTAMRRWAEVMKESFMQANVHLALILSDVFNHYIIDNLSKTNETLSPHAKKWQGEMQVLTLKTDVMNLLLQQMANQELVVIPPLDKFTSKIDRQMEGLKTRRDKRKELMAEAGNDFSNYEQQLSELNATIELYENDVSALTDSIYQHTLKLPQVDGLTQGEINFLAKPWNKDEVESYAARLAVLLSNEEDKKTKLSGRSTLLDQKEFVPLHPILHQLYVSKEQREKLRQNKKEIQSEIEERKMELATLASEKKDSPLKALAINISTGSNRAIIQMIYQARQNNVLTKFTLQNKLVNKIAKIEKLLLRAESIDEQQVKNEHNEFKIQETIPIAPTGKRSTAPMTPQPPRRSLSSYFAKRGSVGNVNPARSDSVSQLPKPPGKKT